MSEKQMPQNVIMENRRKAEISGVTEVKSFDDEEIMLYTTLGRLKIKGSELRINRLSVETGDVEIEGRVDSMTYFSLSEKKSLLTKVLK